MFVLVTYDINVAAPEGAKRLRRERVCSYSCACSCRSPHGERGLKSLSRVWIDLMKAVAPRTGSVD